MKKAKLLDLNDAIQHPGRQLAFDISTQLENEQDLDLIEPVTGRLDAASTGNVLLLTGDFATRVVVECARCLSPVEVSLAIPVMEEFPIKGTPAGTHSQGYAEVDDSDESENPVFQGNSLLYEELLRQALWLAMPTHALCDANCPGLPQEDEDEPVRSEFAELAKNMRAKELRG